jgi:hypothetical protein
MGSRMPLPHVPCRTWLRLLPAICGFLGPMLAPASCPASGTHSKGSTSACCCWSSAAPSAAPPGFSAAAQGSGSAARGGKLPVYWASKGLAATGSTRAGLGVGSHAALIVSVAQGGGGGALVGAPGGMLGSRQGGQPAKVHAHTPVRGAAVHVFSSDVLPELAAASCSSGGTRICAEGAAGRWSARDRGACSRSRGADRMDRGVHLL